MGYPLIRRCWWFQSKLNAIAILSPVLQIYLLIQCSSCSNLGLNLLLLVSESSPVVYWLDFVELKYSRILAVEGRGSKLWLLQGSSSLAVLSLNVDSMIFHLLFELISKWNMFAGSNVLVDKYEHRIDLILAVSLFTGAGLNIAIPYCTHATALFLVIFLLGWLELITNIGKHSTLTFII